MAGHNNDGAYSVAEREPQGNHYICVYSNLVGDSGCYGELRSLQHPLPTRYHLTGERREEHGAEEAAAKQPVLNQQAPLELPGGVVL